jgi:hypothetical protein
MEPNDTAAPERLEVLHLLLLLQGAILLLSGGGMLLFSGGNPSLLPLTVGAPLFVFTLAAGTVRGWRWVREGTLAVECLVLLGLVSGLLLSLAPGLSVSLNLLTLITNVGLPLAIISQARHRSVRAQATAPAERVGEARAAAA